MLWFLRNWLKAAAFQFCQYGDLTASKYDFGIGGFSLELMRCSGLSGLSKTDAITGRVAKIEGNISNNALVLAMPDAVSAIP